MTGLLLLAAFHFAAPAGWTDADKVDAGSLPEAVRDDLSRGAHAFFAVDLRHLDENAVATYSATTVPGAAAAFDKPRADLIAQQLIDRAARKGEKLELVDADALRLGKVAAARVRFSRPFRSDRMDVFFLPAPEGTAVLTFIAPIERYGDYEAEFVKAATAATLDVPTAGRRETVALSGIALVGLLLTAVIMLFRRRRASRRADGTPPSR